MSSHQVLATSSPPQNAKTEVPQIARRTANYNLSVWGHHFISYASNSLDKSKDEDTEKKTEMLKELVKDMILSPIENTSTKLDFIDAVKRLGVAYHFEEEIEIVLKKIHDNLAFNNNNNNKEEENEDLYNVALTFRLLREQGYNVSCDVFNKFKNDEGKFKKSLISDVQGMLSLYEASFFRVHEESILDEALKFTSYHLKSMVAKSSIDCSILADKVTHALNRSLRYSLTRVEAKYFLSAYKQDPRHNSNLLKFAELDFNHLQKLHQEELSNITRWWKELDFAGKLPFARDRVVECYFWALGVYFEPQYSFSRMKTTKIISLATVIDDIYDVFGTLEELELFTQAVDRWDISAIDKLPNYMKLCYKALLDVYTEIGEELKLRNEELYCLDYAIEEMKTLVKAYFKEAKWFHTNYAPTMEEYMALALVSSGYSMVAITSFVGMGDTVTKNSLGWLYGNPKLIKASEIIARLMDDIASHKFEQKRGHIASSVECYMNQFGRTEEEAVNKLREQVCNAWKDINEECLNPKSIPMPLRMRIVNLARVIDLLYKDGDIYTHSGGILKEIITSILIDPII